jgi:SAM-dependent methyltransferase
LYSATVGSLGPGPGTRILHAGCGTGTALRVAARHGATTAGLDSSPELLTIARDRLPDADLRLGEAVDAPYDTGCFDQVMAFDAVQHAERPAAVVAELARITRPGGVVAIGLWHNWSGREASAFMNAVRGSVPAPPAGVRPVADLSRLREVMTESGLDVYISAEVTHRHDFPDLETAWQAMTASRHVARAIEIAGEDAAHDLFVTHFAHRGRPDGSIEQDDLFQYAVGRVTRH